MVLVIAQAKDISADPAAVGPWVGHGPQRYHGLSPHCNLRRQRRPLRLVCPPVGTQTTDINMASGSGIDHRHSHSLGWQHSADIKHGPRLHGDLTRTHTYLFLSSCKATAINMASSGCTGPLFGHDSWSATQYPGIHMAVGL